MTKKLLRLGISFVIVFLVWIMLVQPAPSLDEETPVSVVLRAKTEILDGTLLSSANFERIELPVELIPEGAATFDVEGKVLSYPLTKGEILLEKDLQGSLKEPQVLLTMQTDALSINKGDKVAVMVTTDNDSLTLLDNLRVEEVAKNEYDDSKLIVIGAKEEEAQAVNLLRPKASISIIPSTGGLKAVADPLTTAMSLVNNAKGLKKRQVEVIEGGEVTWHDIE